MVTKNDEPIMCSILKKILKHILGYSSYVFIYKAEHNRRSFLPCTLLPCSHAAA